MSTMRQTNRRPSQVDVQPSRDLQGTVVLMGLRVVLLGCAFALVGVLGHVAWKVVNV